MLPQRLPDLSRLTSAEVLRLRRAYDPMVRAVVALYRLDEVEGFAVGQDAVLEAFLSLDVRRAQESTWVRRVVHWRLAQAVDDAPWDRSAEVESLDKDPQVLNGAGPEEAYVRATAVAAITRLPRRQQMVVDGHMRGETYEEISEQLGCFPSSAHRSGQSAFRALRRLLEPEKEK